MSTEWRINGEFLESCTCKGACPCIYLEPPTEGDCSALVGWHITSGRYGDVPLDDLNVVVALNAPGKMSDGNWKVVLYLDQKADERQQGALSDIFGGKAGGHPEVLASMIGEVLAVENQPIEFSVEQGRRHLAINQQHEAQIQAIEGQNGNEVTVSNHPLAVAPGQPAVVAKSGSLRHRNHGIEIDTDARTAFYSPFDYAGP